MTSYSPAATAYALLHGEAIELPRNLTPLLPAERDDVAQVLRQRYQRDAGTLPGPTPAFHDAAAVYGFACFVTAAHEWYCPPSDTAEEPHRSADPEPTLPRYPSAPTDLSAGELLSADLCLGYLTTLRSQIAGRYLDDLLVKAIAQTLAPWPYTALLLPEAPVPQLGDWWQDPTMRHLYTDRLIERSHLTPTELPEVAEAVETALGAHATTLWPAFAESQKRRTSPA